MPSVAIHMKDGTVMRFTERGRAGGSYSITVRYEGAFVIVTDEWYAGTAVPAADIVKVVTDAPAGRW